MVDFFDLLNNYCYNYISRKRKARYTFATEIRNSYEN